MSRVRGGLLVAAAAATMLWCPYSASAAPSDEVSPQVKGWLTQMLDAKVASSAGFRACPDNDAECLRFFKGTTSFRSPAGVVFCTALGPQDTGSFDCAVRNVTFTLPTRPPQPASQWHATDIRLHDDKGWTLGNFVDSPRVADDANPLAYGTKLVLSHMRSQSGDAPKLECGSFTHGMVCLDHMWGKGFHASRDDFTPFAFPPTFP